MHEKHKEELENEDLQALSAKILELEKWFQQIPGTTSEISMQKNAE